MSQATMVVNLGKGRMKGDPTNPVPGVKLEPAIEEAQYVMANQSSWNSLRELAATIVRRVAPMIADQAVEREREEAAKRPQAPAKLTEKDIARIRADFLDALIAQADREARTGRTGFYDSEIRRAYDWLKALR